MSERDSPLLRWARLKQAAKAAEEAGRDLADSDPIPESAATEASFDPASLPSIESIAADTDVIAFLRAGVPMELTRAALRRAWTSDPAIRDFIGIAENQWDFNDPNGIPGFGPLSAESGVDALARISTRLERLPGTLEVLAPAVEPIRSRTDEQSFEGQVVTDNSLVTDQNAVRHEMEATGGDDDTPGARVRSRRHGSALPR